MFLITKHYPPLPARRRKKGFLRDLSLERGPGAEPLAGGGWGIGAERCQWQMKRGGDPLRHRVMQAAAQQRDNAEVRSAPQRPPRPAPLTVSPQIELKSLT